MHGLAGSKVDEDVDLGCHLALVDLVHQLSVFMSLAINYGVCYNNKN
jgi:hypothetical protein